MSQEKTHIIHTAVIYARVSSKGDRQSTERQVADLTAYAQRAYLSVLKVYEEKASGANDDRPVLQECIDNLADNHEAEVLLLSETSRLSRTVKGVIDNVDRLTKAGVNIHIHDLGLNTLTPEGKENPIAKMMLTVLALGAEMERKSIVSRLNSGRALAKQKGIQFGRKKGTIVKTREDKEVEYAKVLRELRKGTSIARTAKLCDVSISTVKRLKKEFEL